MASSRNVEVEGASVSCVGCACGDVIAREEVFGPDKTHATRQLIAKAFGVGAIAGRPPMQCLSDDRSGHPAHAITDLDIAGQVGRYSIVQRKAAIASGKGKLHRRCIGRRKTSLDDRSKGGVRRDGCA